MGGAHTDILSGGPEFLATAHTPEHTLLHTLPHILHQNTLYYTHYHTLYTSKTLYNRTNSTTHSTPVKHYHTLYTSKTLPHTRTYTTPEHTVFAGVESNS